MSNRTHKLTTIDSQRFTKKINGNAQNNITIEESENYFETLNPVEKAQALTSILPDSKLDIKYDYYYGTNALKTICIPLISASTESSSSNEVLEFNKDVSLRMDSALLKNIEIKNDFSNDSYIRKRITTKYETIVSSRKKKFKAKDEAKLKSIARASKSVYEISDSCTNKLTFFDPFDKESLKEKKQR